MTMFDECQTTTELASIAFRKISNDLIFYDRDGKPVISIQALELLREMGEAARKLPWKEEPICGGCLQNSVNESGVFCDACTAAAGFLQPPRGAKGI